MGDTTNITWADHTFNPWEGCSRVSAECTNCYAEARDNRWHGGVHWGKTSDRKPMSAAYWRKPLKWNREAEAAGVRHRVFCASLADVFEDRPDLIPIRSQLWDLIEATPNLDWLLLTKRPNQIERLTPGARLACRNCMDDDPCCDYHEPVWQVPSHPTNVWLGTTVGHQETISRAEYLVNDLTWVPPVRFVSVEPMLGPVDLTDLLEPSHGINWVICGGESGPNARPINPDWPRSLRDQCAAAGVPFFFKQHGGPTPTAGGHLLDGEVVQEFPTPS